MGSVFGYAQTDTIARHRRMLGVRALLPDGLGRQRPRHRAPGAELLRRPLRPDACRSSPTSPRRRSRATARSRSRRQSFVELCDTARGRGREEVRGAVAPARPLGRLGDDLHDDRRGVATRVAARVPPHAGARRGVLRPRRRRSGTSTTAPRSRRPSSRTARWRARTTRSRSTAIDGAADILIETTRPELIPACVALVAHPDDERYADPLRPRGADAAVRRAGAGRRSPARRSREGLRHRDDLHVR